MPISTSSGIIVNPRLSLSPYGYPVITMNDRLYPIINQPLPQPLPQPQSQSQSSPQAQTNVTEESSSQIQETTVKGRSNRKTKSSHNETTEHEESNKPTKRRKRPPTPYSLYAKEVRNSIREANPGVPSGQIQKMIANAWKAESQDRRKKYFDIAKSEKEKMLSDSHPEEDLPEMDEEDDDEEIPTPTELPEDQTIPLVIDYPVIQAPPLDTPIPPIPLQDIPNQNNPVTTEETSKSVRRRRKSTTAVKRGAPRSQRGNLSSLLKSSPKSNNSKSVEAIGLIDTLKFFNNQLNRFSNAFFLIDPNSIYPINFEIEETPINHPIINE